MSYLSVGFVCILYLVPTYPSFDAVELVRFLFQTIEALSAVPLPELALRLYLQCAEVLENAWPLTILRCDIFMLT